MFNSITTLELTDDVLQLAVTGTLFLSDTQAVFTRATRGGSDSGPRFGALLLDLTQAYTNVAMGVEVLAEVWLKRMPGRPCAVLHRPGEGYFWHLLSAQLAASGAHPTTLGVFEATERAAALQWCQSCAVTYRFELARGLRPAPASSASLPGASG